MAVLPLFTCICNEAAHVCFDSLNRLHLLCCMIKSSWWLYERWPAKELFRWTGQLRLTRPKQKITAINKMLAMWIKMDRDVDGIQNDVYVTVKRKPNAMWRSFMQDMYMILYYSVCGIAQCRQQKNNNNRNYYRLYASERRATNNN